MNIQPISASPTPQSSFEAGIVAREAQAAISVEAKAVAPVPEVEPASQKQLEAAVKSVREYIQPFNSNLEFSIDEETDHVVIKVVDQETKELIRQIPSEEMLAIAKALDSLKGLFVKQQA